MSDAGTKTELLARLRSERETWEGLIDETGEDRMDVSGVCGFWSVKDLLGHLAAYYRVWGAQIKGTLTGVEPTMVDMFDREELPEDAGNWTGDEQNAAIQEYYSHWSLPVVLAKWRFAVEELEDQVARLTDADITEPGKIAWARGDSLIRGMAADTFENAHIHAGQVRAWLNANPR